MKPSQPYRRFFGGDVTLLHIVVVSLSLLLTIGVYDYSNRQLETRTEIRFAADRDRAVGLIKERMRKYEDALWAGVAAIEAHGGDMTYSQWQIFARTLKIDEKYPGINGIGVVHFLSEDALEPYLEQRRSERADFRVHPAHSEGFYIPISFIEPEDINKKAVGLDLAHEVNRRTAALAARDTGEAQITGPIVLVQDAGHTPGFLFYAPYYDGFAPETERARQDKILGAVYAPFVVRKLMQGLLAKDLREVRFSIRDGDELIYDEHQRDEALTDPNPLFQDEVSIDLYGRTWVLDFRTNLAFRATNTYSEPMFILIAGLLIEALIISLLVLMSRANARAVAYADEVTSDLRAKSRILERLNEELEEFSYITSHDLKTPVRGISALAEMLKEDLADYLKSPAANPEVGEHIALIQERTVRMDELIHGVLDFSQMGKQDRNTTSLNLRDAFDALAADFSLAPGQLILESDVEAVEFDGFSLRRVFENLVGNAVKYHGTPSELEVRVVLRDTGDRLSVSVQDNGPGIDSAFHDKVFRVFQTLRKPDEPESTGIGLAIVKKAVALHGGVVELESTTGQGATFSFTWPKSDMRERASA